MCTKQWAPYFGRHVKASLEITRKREGESDASVETRLAGAAFLKPNEKDSYIRSAESHDGEERMRRRFFFFTPLQPWQMQLWLNGSLKVPLRPLEGL